MGDDVQNHQAVLYTATCGNLMSQYNLFTVVMHGGSENKLTGAVARIASHQSGRCCAPAARLKNGPARKATRNFLHVLLRVAAIDTEGVQLH